MTNFSHMRFSRNYSWRYFFALEPLGDSSDFQHFSFHSARTSLVFLVLLLYFRSVVIAEEGDRQFVITESCPKNSHRTWKACSLVFSHCASNCSTPAEKSWTAAIQMKLKFTVFINSKQTCRGIQAPRSGAQAQSIKTFNTILKYHDKSSIQTTKGLNNQCLACDH